ncbi:MAG: glycosyltransferase [Acidobacteria bacterium]|nr:glycosyltransferase [Acidobacteriota bacterium]
MTVPRICIVTADITGPIRNGGIGSAYYSLARLLADAGHDVTVLYTLGSHSEQKTVEYWVRTYRRWGITFVPLPVADGPELKGSHHVKTAWSVYRWLSTRRFDVVHFHEWRGIGFYALQARRQGLCLQNTVTVVGSHSPSLWHREGMHELPRGVDDVEVDHLERESVALADVLWSPSAHMVRWMREHGWTLPARQVIQQYVMRERVEVAGRRERRRVSEFCFFGRLETRKGLDLFCAAVNRLVARGIAPQAVTFLGKVATVDGVDSAEYIAKQAEHWPMPWRIVSTLDRDGAMQYLRGEGRLGVLPSRLDNLPYTVLECLGAAVPFVASTIGGIPEMVHASDRGDVLFDLRPDALASVLESALRAGIRPARFRVAPQATDRGWIRLHETLAARARRQTSKRRAARPAPLVSICITHRDRPALLSQALDAIRRQTYRRFEVVLVDDGSERPEARSALDALESGFARRGWQIIRQPNRYPGAARNAAARAARGKYLVFMDDDNCAKPEALATFVRAAETSKADIVTCFLDVFRGGEAPGGTEPIHRWSFIGGALGVGLVRNCFGDTSCLVRADAYRAIGGMTEDFGVGCEDWEFFAKAAVKGYRISVVPEALVWYRASTTGVQNRTPSGANRLRALRPYMAAAPGTLHAALPLCREPAPGVPEVPPHDAAHVRDVVIFGAGEGGRRAATLARRCGWDVRYVVDNNESVWGTTVHGYPVRRPAELGKRDFDMVLVASMAGRTALSRQLETMGLSYGSSYAYFLDAFATDGMRTQLVI